MDIQTKLMIFAVDLIGPLLLGYAGRYQRCVGDTFFNKMILNNIFVVCPVVSFLSFWVMPLTRDLFWMPVLSLALGFFPGMAAWWIARRKYLDYREQGAYVMAASLANLGTIGGICVYLVYGEQGYGYQQVATLFQYVLMFTFCYPLAQYYERCADGRSRTKVSFWSMVFSKNQIAVVGILMGGALQVAGIPRPAELAGVTPFFIHLGAWTGLVPVGYSLDFGRMRRYWLSLFDLAVLKFVAAPLLLYGLSGFVVESPAMRGSLLLLAATPTAINAVVAARLYHLAVDLTVAAFLVTTLLFLLVVYPALFLLLSHAGFT